MIVSAYVRIGLPMKSKILPLLALLSATLLTSAMANAQDFVITIVGHAQAIDSSHKKDGLPIVICPQSGIHQINGYPMDRPSDHCFFVAIQNTQTVSAVITMAFSAWHESLQFKITDRAGKVYTVEHQQIEWSADALRTWAFPSNGIRIMPVDFTNGAMEGWRGLPPPPPAPETVTMMATFTYYDTATRKSISVSSKPTDVVLSRNTL